KKYYICIFLDHRHHINSMKPQKSKVKYECPICKKSIVNRGYHMRMHTGERPFQCKLCLKDFRQISDLNRHQREVHGHKQGKKIKRVMKGKVIKSYNCQSKGNPFNCELCLRELNSVTWLMSLTVKKKEAKTQKMIP
ncbi:unnamed protein product, partial [Owenia fusiformis]